MIHVKAGVSTSPRLMKVKIMMNDMIVIPPSTQRTDGHHITWPSRLRRSGARPKTYKTSQPCYEASVNKTNQPHAVIKRHEEVLQPLAPRHEVVELTQVLNVAVRLVLAARPRLLVPRRPRVVVAVVGHEPPAEHVVRHDEPARAQQPRPSSRLRPGEYVPQVGRVARLLGVDEDEVVGLFGLQLREACVYEEGLCVSDFCLLFPWRGQQLGQGQGRVWGEGVGRCESE